MGFGSDLRPTYAKICQIFDLYSLFYLSKIRLILSEMLQNWGCQILNLLQVGPRPLEACLPHPPLQVARLPIFKNWWPPKDFNRLRLKWAKLWTLCESTWKKSWKETRKFLSLTGALMTSKRALLNFSSMRSNSRGNIGGKTSKCGSLSALFYSLLSSLLLWPPLGTLILCLLVTQPIQELALLVIPLNIFVASFVRHTYVWESWQGNFWGHFKGFFRKNPIETYSKYLARVSA